MQAYSYGEVKTYMDKYYTDSKLEFRFYQAGINTPAKVELYHDYDQLENLINYAFTVFNRITFVTVDMCADVVNSFSIRYEDIDAAILFLSFLINIIEYSIRNKQIYDYYSILEELADTKIALEKDRTINRRMAMFRLMFNLYKMKGKI